MKGKDFGENSAISLFIIEQHFNIINVQLNREREKWIDMNAYVFMLSLEYLFLLRKRNHICQLICCLWTA